MAIRSGWWRFWDREVWRSWRSDRVAWSTFRTEARGLDGRIHSQQNTAAHLTAQVREAERRLGWVEAVRPQPVPVDTAKSEPGLGAVLSVTLLEMRSRQGQTAWLAVDHGPVYFTDRRMVFDGSKRVEFRYERVESLHRLPQGLYVSVSSRKRPHILSGPVDELMTKLEAARLVAEGGFPAAVEQARLEALQGQLRAAEVDLERFRRQRQALVAPRRPVSPAWLPGAAVLAVVMAVQAATGGGGGTERTGRHDLGAASTTITTAGDGVSSSILDATSTTPPSGETGTTVLPTSTLPPTTSSALPPSTTSTTLSGVPEVDTIDLPAGVGGVAAVLVSVIDGDTLRVLVSGRSEPLRLIGMNAPEQDECLAAEATAYLASLAEGGDLTLIGDVSDRDQYDRLLRYAWVGDVFLNEALVRSGLAIARRYPPDLAYADLFDQAQADAQQAGLGMWATDACGPVTANAMVIVHIEYDAPGDDNQNLNGEWVTFRNDGPGPIDLGGWVLKDESASHRYTFPTGFVLFTGETVTVYSGCGQDTSKNLYWCNKGSAIWKNDGDTAFLLNPSGNISTHLTYTAEQTTTTPTATTHATATTGAATTTTSQNCDPSYPDVCIPPPPPDLDCGEIPYRRFRVIGSDPHHFDGDHDGIGCES
jgi:micrococcal nuclease